MNLIMFDIDGTLTQSCEYDRELFSLAVTGFLGIGSMDTDWSHYPDATSQGIASEAILRATGKKADDTQLHAIEMRFLSHLESRRRESPDDFREVPGASSLLRELSARNDITVSVATGCWFSEATFKLQASDIQLNEIPMATSSDELSRKKIIRASEKKARGKSGIKKFDTVIYIGDGIWDLRAAKDLRVKFIGVGERIDELDKSGSTPLFRDYSDIRLFMKEIDRMVGL